MPPGMPRGRPAAAMTPAAALLRPRASALSVLLASAAVLAAALLSQYAGGLEPCALCVYQRAPYAAAIALAAAGLALADRRRAVGGLHGLAAAVFLAGAGIAAYHAGVEWRWWAGTEACGGAPGAGARSVAELRAQIMAAPAVRCDEAAWSLFGVSMAGYNFLASLALAGFSAAAAGANLRRGPA